MKMEETYTIAGMELGCKITEEFVSGTETIYSGYLGKMCDKYRKFLEKIGMKVNAGNNYTQIDLIRTLADGIM